MRWSVARKQIEVDMKRRQVAEKEKEMLVSKTVNK